MLDKKESERNLEEDFVSKLKDLKYDYRSDIKDREGLEANFRKKFETLNRVNLSKNEFQRLLTTIVTPDVFKASKLIRNIETFDRDDGTPLNYTLINTKDWCKNTYEVTNQLRINTDYSHHRYDVVLLINDIPVVQVELKTYGINPRRAMEQIVKYKQDPGNGFTKTLLCFVQLFIVSNSADTFYFTNNNLKHFAFDAKEQFLPIYQFAKQDNTKITNLFKFADHFLRKCTLGEMISKYMVLIESEQKLLMMRPYQIYAVESILECVKHDSGNGYIWHTTGAGKTLTSFKASTLLKSNEDIHKCIFVVDRKDLDRQTRDEFNRFQENCVEENTNTDTLVRRLLSNDYAHKVIVTTIQKLGIALNQSGESANESTSIDRRTFKQRLQSLKDKRMVFIFDECHRSQFGENHQAIKNFFPKSQLFGFTGTPIFEANASVKKINGDIATLRTTEDLFAKLLHSYTITDAIEDKYVLRIHIEYFKPKKAQDIDQTTTITKRAVVEAILKKHDSATCHRRFNALFATASINDAIEYYEVFKTLQPEYQKANPEFVPLKVAAIFSPPADGDKDIQQIQEDLTQERIDNQHNPESKKIALMSIISDYNERYRTNRDMDNFDVYYQDIQGRIKKHEFTNSDLADNGNEKIDITIVVDMLLTGFDAKYLNTLYVDKNLRHHGLIQAFSRTNRILNASKPYGNIVDFRQQKERVDGAITLFCGNNLERSREIWLVEKPNAVINKYEHAVSEVHEFMQSQGLEMTPDQINNLKGDHNRVEFIQRFKEVQRLKNQLDQYTNITDEQRTQIQKIISEKDFLGFRCAYLQTAKRLLEERGTPIMGGEESNPELEQLDLELVMFASNLIDYDYIMNLISRYSFQDPIQQKVTKDELISLIRSDSKFLDEHDDITAYVRSLKEGEGLTVAQIRDDYEKFKINKQSIQIRDIAHNYGLTDSSLSSFVDAIVQRKVFEAEQLTDLMTSLELSWHDRYQREQALMADLVPILKKRARGQAITGLSGYEYANVDECI